MKSLSQGSEKATPVEIIELKANSMVLALPSEPGYSSGFRQGNMLRIAVKSIHGAITADVPVISLVRTERGPGVVVPFPNEWKVNDNRISIRVPVDISAAVSRPDDVWDCNNRRIPVQILDISVSGARLLSRWPFADGDELILQFIIPLDNSNMAIPSRVVRHAVNSMSVRSAYEFAVEFTAILSRDIGKLEAYIDILMNQYHNKVVNNDQTAEAA